MGAHPQSWPVGAPGPRAQEATRVRHAVWLVMTAVTSLFLALTYAYLRTNPLDSGPAGAGWMPPALGWILTANTAVLLLSSAALAYARRRLHAHDPAQALRWTGIAAVLGFGFLYGQAQGWRLLFNAGIYTSNYPESGFFYLVTAVHAAHLAVALGILLWMLSRLWRGRMPPDRALAMDITAVVWHCLDVMWVYLFAVIIVYR